ncbi:MAG: L,D-transpeptidase [Myxococcales bacterium]|nr:L,D-transpeptidase [Myxococcales bacterium]
MRLRTSIVAIAAGVALAAVGTAMTLEARGGVQVAGATPERVPTPSAGGFVRRIVEMLGLSRANELGGPVILAPPENPHVLTKVAAFGSPLIPAGRKRALAYHYDSHVFRRPGRRPKAVGFVRRGVTLPVGSVVRGPGCQGTWYDVRGGPGVVCSRDGFAISARARQTGVRQPPPDVSRALPFKYAKANPGALRMYRLPTGAEEASLSQLPDPGEGQPDPSVAPEGDAGGLPEVVERRMDGVFLLALDRLEPGGAYYRTVRGRYVRKRDVELKPEPGLRGELLSEGSGLPLAFVYGEEDAPVYRMVDGKRVPAGAAKTHSRYGLAELTTWDGEPVATREDGIAVPRTRVRIARRVGRPRQVKADDKWIHVDLDEQTLVAYEGETPVFATLVSSGKGEEFATPTGLYPMREKHISTTMNGPDPDAGYYEVEEVPWTMYYHDSFALHGAYWHNTFGNTRSHGCTNLSPIDARWLFYWSDGTLPKGWNALRQLKGTWVYLTRG